MIRDGLPMASVGSSGLDVLAMGKHVQAELSSALSDTRTRLLLRPRIQLANHEKGTVDVTRSEPIVQTYYNNSNSGTYTTSGQSTVKTGLQVDVTPHISNRGLVELEVKLTNSTGDIIENIGNNTRGVATNEQTADTVMIIPSGETRVIGGLISRSKSETESGIPYLAKIPYLGYLFGKKSDDNTLRNLLFFVTATIIEEPTLNDDVVEPVNDLARVALEEASSKSAAKADQVSKIPSELVPYLEQIRPEAIPMPGEETESTTSTIKALSTQKVDLPTTLTLGHTNELTTGALTKTRSAVTTGTQVTTSTLTLKTSVRATSSSLSSARNLGQQLLTNQPYVNAAQTDEAGGKVGGAVSAVSGGMVGPKGTFGATGSTGGGKGGKGTASMVGSSKGKATKSTASSVKRGSSSGSSSSSRTSLRNLTQTETSQR